jgi:RNA polymerase sigma-70 factor, ECF subfamily
MDMAVSEVEHHAARHIDDLYRAHSAEVYRYALAVLGHRADAEDVTQTTFLNAYGALERGVTPRKPSNWLLTIASNVIKQRFRSEASRPRHTSLDEHAARSTPDDETPTIGELLVALGAIPPLQRQALVLREFEGRSYAEIADILGVSTSALETLLFRARRSLAEELESQLTCTDVQQALSRAVDGRLGRKERRRLRGHMEECPDCARFARVQQRNRRAFRGLALVPIPVLEWPFRGADAQVAAALSVPTATASVAVASSGTGAAAGVGGAVALKAAALVTAASVAGGVGVAGGAKVERTEGRTPPAARVDAATERPGKRIGQVAPRGVAVPGNGVALGRTSAVPRPTKKQTGLARGRGVETKQSNSRASRGSSARSTRAERMPARGRSAEAKAKPKPKLLRGAKTSEVPPGTSQRPDRLHGGPKRADDRGARQGAAPQLDH